MISANLATVLRRQGDAPDLLWTSIESVRRTPFASWLAPRERALHDGFTIPKRRNEWLAGRLAAKEIVRRHQATPVLRVADLRDIEIRARRWGLHRGRPHYYVRGRPGARCLSIAHSGDIALAGLSRGSQSDIGVDIEAVLPLDERVEALALSPHEILSLRGLRGERRARTVAIIWVLKEALVKAVGVGLRVPLAAIRVDLDPLRETLAPRPFSVSRGSGLLTLLRRFAPGATGKHFELADRIGGWVELDRRSIK